LRLGEESDIKTFMAEFVEAGMVPMEMIGKEIESGEQGRSSKEGKRRCQRGRGPLGS
jgi:hypothetical protein